MLLAAFILKASSSNSSIDFFNSTTLFSFLLAFFPFFFFFFFLDIESFRDESFGGLLSDFLFLFFFFPPRPLLCLFFSSSESSLISPSSLLPSCFLNLLNLSFVSEPEEDRERDLDLSSWLSSSLLSFLPRLLSPERVRPRLAGGLRERDTPGGPGEADGVRRPRCLVGRGERDMANCFPPSSFLNLSGSRSAVLDSFSNFSWIDCVELPPPRGAARPSGAVLAFPPAGTPRGGSAWRGGAGRETASGDLSRFFFLRSRLRDLERDRDDSDLCRRPLPLPAGERRRDRESLRDRDFLFASARSLLPIEE